MRNKVTVKLSYVDNKGRDKEYKFDIGFISNRILRDYTELQKNIRDVNESWMKIQKLQLSLEEKDITESKVEEILKKIQVETDKVQDINASDFFERRFSLVKSILNRNGYTGKKEYLTPEFWDENVEPSAIIDFLSSCVMKDATGKK